MMAGFSLACPAGFAETTGLPADGSCLRAFWFPQSGELTCSICALLWTLTRRHVGYLGEVRRMRAPLCSWARLAPGPLAVCRPLLSPYHSQFSGCKGRDLEQILTQYTTFVKPAFGEFCLLHRPLAQGPPFPLVRRRPLVPILRAVVVDGRGLLWYGENSLSASQSQGVVSVGRSFVPHPSSPHQASPRAPRQPPGPLVCIRPGHCSSTAYTVPSFPSLLNGAGGSVGAGISVCWLGTRFTQ